MHESATQVQPELGPPRTSTRLSLTTLDALRGLAALYVMLSHARWFLWATHKEYLESSRSAIGTLFASASASLDYSHHAVLLFFVISGFCIHYRQAVRLADDQPKTGKKLFNIPSFAVRRVRRLYPALAVALLLTMLLDFIGMRMNPAFYTGLTPYPGINMLGRPDFSPTTIVGNLLLQSSLSVPVLGNNAPLWSLAWEFWFYALYPVVLILSVRLRTAGMLAVTATVSVLSLAASISGIVSVNWVGTVLTYWVVWAAGAMLAEVYAGRTRVPHLKFMALIAGLLAVGVAWALALRHVNYLAGGTVEFNDPVTDLLLSLSIAVLLGYLMLELPVGVGQQINRLSSRLAFLGDMSYSLYVIHYPWLMLISAWWLLNHERLPLGAELAIPGAISALILGWCLWYTVERHCVSGRRYTIGVTHSKRFPAYLRQRQLEAFHVVYGIVSLVSLRPRRLD